MSLAGWHRDGLSDDIKYLAPPVLGHRLILQDAEQLRGVSSKQVINDILDKEPIPIETSNS